MRFEVNGTLEKLVILWCIQRKNAQMYLKLEESHY